MIPKLLLRHGRLECREGKRLLNRRRECSSWKSRHTEGKTEEQTSWHVGGEQNCCCAKNEIAPICVNELSSEKSPDAQASCHALLTLSIYTAVMFTGQALILI